MKDLQIRSQLTDSVLELPVSFIDEHLKDASGLSMKIYLYLLRASKSSGISVSLDGMASFFGVTPDKVLLSLGYWASRNVLTLTYAGDELSSIVILPYNRETSVSPAAEAQSAPVETIVFSPETPKEALQEDSVSEISSASAPAARGSVSDRDSEAFQELLSVFSCYAGKQPSKRVEDSLFTAYETLHFSAEMTEYLIEYCFDRAHQTPSYLEKTASEWRDAGYTTLSEVKEKTSKRNRRVNAVLRALSIDRTASPAELSEIRSWLGDFELSLVEEACSRTISQIHKPDFRYVSGILSRWKSAGVVTISDVRALDAVREQKAEEKTRKPERKSQFRDFPQRSTDYDEIAARFDVLNAACGA